jgi:hypothetical protein
MACIAPLRHELGLDCEFEFVEGSVPWASTTSKQTQFIVLLKGKEGSPSCAEIKSLFPSHEGYAYYDTRSISSFTTALDDLETYLLEEGPFEGVLAYSQGAALMASYLARQRLHGHSNLVTFKFAVLVCTGPPLDPSGSGNYLSASVVGEVINIPTAIIFGSRDEAMQTSIQLSELCSPETRTVFDHGGGHEIPRTAKATTGMANAIRAVLRRAS